MPGPTRFHSNSTQLAGRVFGNHTMLDVLQQNAGGGAYASLGSYVVAALLNAADGKTPYLPASTIRKMWNDLISFGYFQPTAGVRWNADQIEAYLRTTMR
jgi:hypothetical protein